MALMVGQLIAVIDADASKYFAVAKRVEATHDGLVKKTSGNKAVIDGDAKPFERETKRAIQSAGIMRAKVGNFIGEIRGELLTVGAVGGILMGFKSVVMAASDLAESANAINVTFGAAASQVMQFTSTASTSIGQSDAEARGAAATFGVYGKQAGLAAGQNAAFSISLVKLASDMASFRNTTPTEAIEALGAALRGESDPIEAYGVLLTESVLAQRALKMGVIETTSQALTPQQRVLVAYQEILSQTKDMQGDFGRTSDALANGLRTLRARVIDQAAAMGQDLLPAATSLVSFLGSAVGPTFEVVGAILKAGLGVLSEVADGWNSLPGPIQAALVALVAWNLVQDRVASGFDKMSSPLRTFADDVQHVMTASQGSVNQFGATMQVLQERSQTLGEMGTAFRSAKGDADGFGSSVRGIGAAAGAGLKSGLSSLMGVLGGPWGIAIAAGTFLLGQWMAASQRAKQKQEELATAGRSVAKAIAEQNGVLNQSTRQAAAKAAEDGGLLKLADKTGIALSRVTDVIEGQKGAYGDLTGAINKRLDVLTKESDQLVANNQDGSERHLQIVDEAAALEALKSGLEGTVGSRDSETAALLRTAKAAGLSADQISQIAAASGAATANLSPMAAAMTVMADESASAEDKVNALQQALDQLTQENLTTEEAVQAINDTLRDLGVAFDEAKTAAANAGTELVNASGAIDTTTEAGSSLQNKLVQLSSDYNGLFAATMEAAEAQGKEMPEAIAAAVQATAPMRQRFLDIAGAAGLNADQVAVLTERYGLLPDAAATMITQPGMMQGLLDALGLGKNIRAIPDQWTTVLSSTAPEQIALMESLGFKVQHLPNGDVLVTVDSAGARAELDEITQPRTVRLTLQASGYSGQALSSAMKQLGNADGRVAEYYGAGGLRPMSANMSAVVGSFSRTGVVRGIGDNPVADEAFIVLQRNNMRSQAILDEVLHRMRPELYASVGGMPRGGASYGGGGVSAPAAGGGSYVDQRSITVNAAPSVPTMQQLQDLQHEQNILYGG